MIDVKKPLELADGTPVTFVEVDADGDFKVLVKGDERYFLPNGEHRFGSLPHLRNVAARQFDPSKPVRTRDGRKARIICTDRKDPNYPVLALVGREDGTEYPQTYTADGRGSHVYQYSNSADLVNVPEGIVSFVNVYSHSNSFGMKYPNADRADAEASANRHVQRLALLKVSYSPEEGASVEVVADYTSREPII